MSKCARILLLTLLVPVLTYPISLNGLNGILQRLSELGEEANSLNTKQTELLSSQDVISHHISSIGAQYVHGLGITGNTVAVAVIDSGINADLVDDVIGQHCFTGGALGYYQTCPPNNSNVGSTATDISGHGTYTAGIITLPKDEGVAPDSKIVAIRILSPTSSFSSKPDGSFVDLALAINWAVDNRESFGTPIRVINISLGKDRYYGDCNQINSDVTKAVNNAIDKGIVIFAGSGNDGWPDSIRYPACLTGVISVGAVYDGNYGRTPLDPAKFFQNGCEDKITDVGKVTCFSNINGNLDLLAPGYLIGSIQIPGGDIEGNGTSFASPQAAGVAALMKSLDGDLTRYRISDILYNTGDSVTGVKAPLKTELFRRINAYNAVLEVLKQKLSINSYDISGTTNGYAKPSASLTIHYTIANNTPVTLNQIMFGASLFDSKGNECYDQANDKQDVLKPGTNNYSRTFNLGSTIGPTPTNCGNLKEGKYDLVLAIWHDKNTSKSIDSGDTVLSRIPVQKQAITIDGTPPNSSITSGPSGTVSNSSVTFAWTGSDNFSTVPNLRYSYKLDGFNSDWSSPSTTTSVSFNGLSNTSYTFYVRAIDEAGNESLPASRSFTVNASTSILGSSTLRMCSGQPDKYGCPSGTERLQPWIFLESETAVHHWIRNDFNGSPQCVNMKYDWKTNWIEGGQNELASSSSNDPPRDCTSAPWWSAWYSIQWGSNYKRFGAFKTEVVVTDQESGTSRTYMFRFTRQDNTPPLAPVISSTTHPNSTTWYTNNNLTFNWTIPNDPSGIVNYSYILDQNASTTPDTLPDTSATSSSSSNVSDGEWWYHVRAQDGAGNWGSAAHYKVRIDANPPNNPVDINSSSHTINTPSADNTIDMIWSSASDVGQGSGVEGYGIDWNTNPNWTCDKVKDLAGPVTSTTSPALSNGNWWFHLCTKDNAGNWAGTAHSGPYVILNNKSPRKPTNSSPLNGAINVSNTPTLQSSKFSDPEGDSHQSSQWQIRTDSGNYSSPAWDSGSDANNKLSVALPPGILAYSTKYWWHVRYQDSRGAWSDWSTETNFTTQSNPPTTPTNISPADGATNVPVIVDLKASDFSDPDAGDSHKASRWQICSSQACTSVVYDSQEKSAQITYTVPANTLGLGKTYWWRVQYKDQRATWSQWSNATSFTTIAISGPDLIGNFAQLILTCKKDQRTIDLTFNVRNVGNDQTYKGFQVDFILSKDIIIDEYDYSLFGLSTGNKLKSGSSISLSGKSDPMNYCPQGNYVIAFIDRFQNIPEQNEDNNIVIYGPLTPASSNLEEGIPLEITGIQSKLNYNLLEVTAEGKGISQIQVTVFDLMGRSIFTETKQGNQLWWDLTRANGYEVPNGIYIYVVTIWGHDSKGSVSMSAVRKLLILR